MAREAAQGPLAACDGPLAYLDVARILGTRELRCVPPDSRVISQFLINACPDHHVRDGSGHLIAKATAENILRLHPEVARANIYTAVVCGDIDEVKRILATDPAAANRAGGPKGSAGPQSAQHVLRTTDADYPRWTPLLYLCFARRRDARANDNAAAIAQLLIEHGADVHAYFMAGGSQYTPLVGVIGAGEEGREPHPANRELINVLFSAGANPLDMQVQYNLHFARNFTSYLQLMYDECVRRGRKAEWDDPEWSMIDMGGYGFGARWHLGLAVEQNNVPAMEWLLSHGAAPHATLYEIALANGREEAAELLVRYGAKRSDRVLDAAGPFIAACMRRDRAAATAMLTEHPDFLTSHTAMHAAAERDRPDAIAFLAELGVSMEVENARKQQPLHTAAWRDARRSAAYLIERGVSVDSRETEWGNTPLDFASHAGHTAMIDLIAPHSRDIWNLVFYGKLERLRELIANEPGLARTTSDDGWTPLMWSACDEDAAIAIADLLIANGADVAAKNRNGETAADIAAARWMKRLEARLISPLA